MLPQDGRGAVFAAASATASAVESGRGCRIRMFGSGSPLLGLSQGDQSMAGMGPMKPT
jgi:hypothetical protein